MKIISTDYTLAEEDFEVWVDAAVRPITVILPEGVHSFKISKIDDSPNPVMVQLPPIEKLDCQYESYSHRGITNEF
jgi:hypothetical protein